MRIQLFSCLVYLLAACIVFALGSDDIFVRSNPSENESVTDDYNVEDRTAEEGEPNDKGQGSSPDKGRRFRLPNNPFLLDKLRMPVIITTWNYTAPCFKAFDSIYRGKLSSVKSVVDGISLCEFNTQECSSTVGYGSNPDENGNISLDAMIMDGTTMNSGAVGALTRVKNAIGVAYNVLNNTKHSLLVGEEANNFADLMGYPIEVLQTPTSTHVHTNWKQNKRCQPNFWQLLPRWYNAYFLSLVYSSSFAYPLSVFMLADMTPTRSVEEIINNVKPESTRSCGPYSTTEVELTRRGFPTYHTYERSSKEDIQYDTAQIEDDYDDNDNDNDNGSSMDVDIDEDLPDDIDYFSKDSDNYNYHRMLHHMPNNVPSYQPEDILKLTNHDSIGMIAIDADGNIAAGSSSNGRVHKIPGRVGSAAIVGAAAFADSRVGAALATGDGDVIQRFSPSALAVEKLRAGESAFNSAHGVINTILQYVPDFFGAVIVVTNGGEYSAACSGLPKFPFTVMNLILKRPFTFWIKCSNAKNSQQKIY